MKKNVLYALITFGVLFGLASCSDDDKQYYDPQWKEFNDKMYYKAEDRGYNEYKSLSGNGSIFMKKYTKENWPFVEVEKTDGVNVTAKVRPVFGDSVVVRYVGWYYNYEEKPYVFDTTENKHTIDGVEYNNMGGNRQDIAGFRLGKGLIDGWITALYRMDEGDAANIAIPYTLAYGASGYGKILGYTTLWFDLKLVKVIPANK